MSSVTGAEQDAGRTSSSELQGIAGGTRARTRKLCLGRSGFGADESLCRVVDAPRVGRVTDGEGKPP
jgi:hypothetical protein